MKAYLYLAPLLLNLASALPLVVTDFEVAQATVDVLVTVTEGDEPTTASLVSLYSGQPGGVQAPLAVNAAVLPTSVAPVNNAAVLSTTPAASTTPTTLSTVAASSASSASSASGTDTSLSSSSSDLPASIGNINGDLKDFEQPTNKFVDGTVKCSDFPTDQGVIKLPWIGRNGWASVTNPADGNTSTTCQEGWLCSYACQPGMSKTQWPSEQPASGESRGGLLCKNGYLYKTRATADYLCEWGLNTNYAVSKLDKVLSLCRTDYPGSENMNIPTRLLKGDKKPMSTILEDNYYTWKGGKTSSQYYVNNAGVDVDQGCVWGNESTTIGNWAPVVLGSGYTQDKTWLSIIPNPNNEKAPNFNLIIEAEAGATLNGNCSYVNGQYSGGPGSKTDGCTVAVTGGTANYVFY